MGIDLDALRKFADWCCQSARDNIYAAIAELTHLRAEIHDLEYLYAEEQMCNKESEELCICLREENERLRKVKECAKYTIERFYQKHELKHHVIEWGIRELQQALTDSENEEKEKA